MKITLKPNMKPMKQRPYYLNPKYKERASAELDKMLTIGIIEPVEESYWIKIMTKDKRKMTFVIEWRSFQYTVMPFGLKNVPTTSSHLAIAAFKDFIHKFLEVYFDDWTIFGLVKHHVANPEKITVIINLEASRNVKQLHETLAHIGYYMNFIKSYAQITVSMENLLKKDATFCWSDECQKSLDVLKAKMVTASILVFSDWKKEFHVHMDASCIALGLMLT
eukprot:PITA_31255